MFLNRTIYSYSIIISIDSKSKKMRKDEKSFLSYLYFGTENEIVPSDELCIFMQDKELPASFIPEKKISPFF